MGPVSVSSASQIAVSSMRLCVVSCALPEISRTVPACSISAAQPPRPCIPFALQLPSVQTLFLKPSLSSCIGLDCQKGKRRVTFPHAGPGEPNLRGLATSLDVCAPRLPRQCPNCPGRHAPAALDGDA